MILLKCQFLLISTGNQVFFIRILNTKNSLKKIIVDAAIEC